MYDANLVSSDRLELSSLNWPVDLHHLHHLQITDLDFQQVVGMSLHVRTAGSPCFQVS